ncbi:hypothetical protein Trydic_g15360 [Trypoxylus dichotomus]
MLKVYNIDIKSGEELTIKISEQTYTIEFCFILGHSITKASVKLQQACGTNASLKAQILRWFSAFSEDRNEVESRSRSSSAAINDENAHRTGLDNTGEPTPGAPRSDTPGCRRFRPAEKDRFLDEVPSLAIQWSVELAAAHTDGGPQHFFLSGQE